MNTDIPNILPHERVFPIQIGSELFRLSGASISSDAPSYFSQFFQCQLKQAEENGDDSNSIRTLYIDRDPVTFKDISLHLQGYHVAPRDGSHFVKLFADAQFYSLPRLIFQLYEESIFISIGHRDFQIPRELFSDPGNSPNYFSLGFAVFFSTPTEVFPGLSREGLLRPPSIMPPSVPNRSADTFAELLHLLRGYPLHIKSEDHRAELLRDCRYFHLKGLEQKLIRHSITFNLARKRSEIALRLEDVRQSGISVVTFPSDSDSTSPPPDPGPATPVYNASHFSLAYVNYARPFVDEQSYELVLEIGDECTRLHLSSMRCEFFGDGKARISKLFDVIATKLNLPNILPLGLLMKKGGASSQPPSPGNTPISEDWVRCVVGEEAYVRLDGKEWRGHGNLPERGDGDSGGSNASSVIGVDESFGEPSRKRRRGLDGGVAVGGGDERQSWVIKTGQWRLRIQNSRNGHRGVECLLVAVKLDAVSGEFGRNAQRGFLGG
ncbi:uncharacterized protein LY89DRAFT_694184 [Mollisia scopiformis]|uniref:BTB/POZ domain-containing protein n=1 Tax=Mollisia scopiformis TaxID=149040 RepID=A0A194XMZ4_MOLSC|nr:uncharacterized protein LY89DRAFT_694184 [Mollisia scopiformis]KUJ21635.1 hypothetical protein LY89DRAFT_694184 [Mollisia scopiformis]